MTGEEAVEESLTFLGENLALDATELATHVTVTVAGCDQPEAISHIGRFLVGSIAQAITTDLTLAPPLLSAGLDGQAELRSDVDKIIGAEGTELADYERTHTRDPWIGEALGQLMLVLARNEPHVCVPAPMVAAIPPHVEAREHGLDLFGFCHPELMVVIGEAKTSKSGISSALSDALSTLAEIEAGERDHHVRQAANALRNSLPDDVQPLVVGSFWKKARCYLPVICFESGTNPLSPRDNLATLTEDVQHRRLIAIQHEDHDRFLNEVAAAMRDAIPSISPA